MMMWTSSTPWSASSSQHDLEDGLAHVGRRIGGSGSEMSSTAIVTFIPGASSACSGSVS